MEHVVENIRILFIEDSKADIGIMYNKLSDSFDCPVHMDVASTADQFRGFLNEGKYDIILASDIISDFSALAALILVKEICPSVPFIYIMDKFYDKCVAQMLKNGTADYIVKDMLYRLPFAVRNAIENARKENERRLTEQTQKQTIEKLEKSLLVAMESSQLVLDSIRDGVAVFDLNGTVLKINKEFARRYSNTVTEMLGRNIRDLLPENKYGNLYQKRIGIIHNVIENGRVEISEDSRDSRWYSNRYYPVFRDGSVTSVIVFSEDITDRRSAEAEAEKRAEAEARLDVITNFFTNISHEFKTPLTIILNSIEMMENKFRNTILDKKDSDFRAFAILRQNSHRLLRLVSNLLDITKIDAGYLHVNLQEIKITEWMSKLVESVIDYAAGRGIEINYFDDSEIMSLQIDGEMLDRIMLNLLSNAIKHTEKGGQINITMTDSDDKLLITIADNGEGIPEDKKDVIFDRFKQVNTSLTRASEGSGIGLALTKSLVELLDGKVWFESKPGEGTKFYVELPIIQDHVQKSLPIKDGLALKRKIEMEFSDIL